MCLVTDYLKVFYGVLNYFVQRLRRRGNYLSVVRSCITNLRCLEAEQQQMVDGLSEIYELEDILYKRFKGLGIEGRSAEDALKEQPFEKSAEYGIYNAYEDSKLSVLKRIQASCDLFKLRQYLSDECYIGVVGPQDAGKSTFINKMWEIDVGPIGYRQHTQTAKVYTIRKAKKMKVKKKFKLLVFVTFNDCV